MFTYCTCYDDVHVFLPVDVHVHVVHMYLHVILISVCLLNIDGFNTLSQKRFTTINIHAHVRIRVALTCSLLFDSLIPNG